MKKIIPIISFFLFVSSATSQTNQLDSLREVVNTTKNNETKINALVNMVYDLTSFGKFDTANTLALQAEQLAKKINNKKLLANIYNAQGINFQAQGNFPQAIDTYFEAVNINEELQDELRLAFNYGNISNIYSYQKNYDESLHYLKFCLDIFKKQKQRRHLALTYANIGKIYLKQNQNTTALKNFYTAIDIEKTEVDSSQLAYFYGLIGTAYYQNKNYSNSISYLTRAIEIKEKRNDKISLAESYINIGATFLSMDNYKLSNVYSKKAENLVFQINSMELKKELYLLLSNTEFKKRNFEKSLEYYKTYIDLKDSVYSIEKAQKTIQTKLQFDYDKKSALKQLQQEKKDAIALEKTKRKNAILIGVSLLLLLFIFFIYFLYKSNLSKKKINNQLNFKNNYIQEQKIEVEKQKQKIENQQKEMVDSINYAKRIQYALLAQENILKQNLIDYFVLFNPKDIVSGDFYWFAEHLGTFYLAVCDSTGHGVPGAFMSLLNIGYLSEAIKEKNIIQPNEILNYVRQRLIDSISNDGQQDGMDCILVSFDKGNEMSYAAANNGPLLIRNNKIITLPKDKMPVGKGEKTESFTLHTINLQKGDMLYLYTDGYADQFGGPKGKKFKYNALNELLLKIVNASTNEQKMILETTFSNWKGVLEQVDDVCVLGIKI